MISDIRFIIPTPYLFKDIGVEIYTQNKQAPISFCLDNEESRDFFFYILEFREAATSPSSKNNNKYKF